MPILDMPIRLYKQLRRQTRRCDLGQDLVEFALVLPLILMLTIGIMDVARVVMIYTSLSNAAREGARYGIVADHPNNAHIKARVVAAAPGTGITTDDVTVKRRNDAIKVTIIHEVPLVVGFLVEMTGGRDALTITASSRMKFDE